MPDRWTISRVVSYVDRTVLAPAGFVRRGNVCSRDDAGLTREIRFYTPRWGDPAEKGIQVLLVLRLSGLPEAVGKYRREALWTGLERIRGANEYARPARDDPPPGDLVEDVAGPALDFLCRAQDLRDFADMARLVHAEDRRWGPFKFVYPFGTGPLQAAAYAELLAGRPAQADELIEAVISEERDPREVRDFRAELARLRTS